MKCAHVCVHRRQENALAETDMTRVAGSDRLQLLLLPDAIDDYVASDNPVRFRASHPTSLRSSSAQLRRRTRRIRFAPRSLPSDWTAALRSPDRQFAAVPDRARPKPTSSQCRCGPVASRAGECLPQSRLGRTVSAINPFARSACRRVAARRPFCASSAVGRAWGPESRRGPCIKALKLGLDIPKKFPFLRVFDNRLVERWERRRQSNSIRRRVARHARSQATIYAARARHSLNAIERLCL
jgi:hypothetical protein